jgi:MoaA/NifB/PqqE/SkfB family radical SAM enzyme
MISAWRKLSGVDWAAALKGIWEYSILRRLRTVPPRQLVIDVTYRCNSRCVMCSLWKTDGKSELTLAQFDQILSEPLFGGIERLMVSGGEPTLRKDLPSLVEACIRRMPALRTLSLITNGLWPERVLFMVEEIARQCATGGISLSISVSLDGLEETHDTIRNVPGAFAKACETLEGLRELQERYGFYLGVGCVICHLNLHQLDSFREWCAEHNLPCGFQLVGFHDSYVDNLDQQEALDFAQGDLPVLYALMEELAAKRSFRNWMAYYWADMLCMYREGRERQSPCPFLVDSFVLDAHGNIRVCETGDDLGNCLVDGSCTELYYSAKTAAMREAMAGDVCRTCNSGCLVNVGLRKDITKYLRFLLLGTW